MMIVVLHAAQTPAVQGGKLELSGTTSNQINTKQPFQLNRILALGILLNVMSHQDSFAANFGDDVAFIRKHTDVILLTDKSKSAQVAVAPAWQGRVMTSTAGGANGASFGWINRELIASGKLQPHINVFGGEDRFWLGPEGGQFSIFFAPGAKFELSDWFTPAPLDTMPYRVVKQSAESVSFAAEFTLTNYSGTRFDVRVNRAVKLLSAAEAWKHLGVRAVAGVNLVAFETDNRITNVGKV